MEDSIFAQIRNEGRDFYEQSITVVPGYSFNQYDTLKRIHLYLNSKYENGGMYLNRELLFYNVVVPPCEVATRMLNLDTKNIRLWPDNPKHYFSTYLLEKELKLWLKTSKMGKLLNQIAEEAPRYGTVVLEKTTKGAELVDLRRLILDPTVENIQKSRFVTTIHYFTPSELRATGWDNVEQAIERFGSGELQEPFEDEYGNLHQMQSTPYIKVYRRFGEVPRRWIDGSNSDEMVKAVFIVAGADFLLRNDEGKEIGEAGLVLFKSKWVKPWPFKDYHYTKIRGRWLGLGIVEMLFDVQVRMNEIKNQKRISMEISSLHLFQTKDKTIVRNLLTDMQNGDILTTANGIEPVANEERNLTAFDGEEESYAQQADRLSFAYEAVRGEPAAASTPATNQILATQAATSVYAFKRENLSLFYQDFFNDLVLPQLLKDLSKEHIMRFTGSRHELQRLDEAASELYAQDLLIDRLRQGVGTTPEQYDAAKELAKREFQQLGDTRYVKVKDHLYDDVKFEFDFVISNEQVDPQTLATNLQTVLASYNPEAMQDQRFKMLYFKYAEILGIPRAEVEIADQEATQREQLQMSAMNEQPA